MGELKKHAAKYAKEHGVPLSEVRRRWLLDKLAAKLAEKKGSKNGRRGKSATIATSAASRRRRATAVDSRNDVFAQQVPDLNLKKSAPRSSAKKLPVKQAFAPMNGEKAASTTPWSPVEVKLCYGDGTSLETYKAQFLVADPDAIVLRVRGAGKFNYRSNNPGSGNKVYYVDTDEPGREETLQFMRGLKRLFGTWRSRSSAGGWSVAFRDV